jgi:hypothetical protein
MRLLILVLTIAFSFEIAMADDFNRARAAWEKIIRSRSEIVSGHLELCQRYLVYHGGTDNDACAREIRYSIWFNEDMCRYDCNVFELATGMKIHDEDLSFRRIQSSARELRCLVCDDVNRMADEVSTEQATSQLLPPIALGCANVGLMKIMSQRHSTLISFENLFRDYRGGIVVNGSNMTAHDTGDMLAVTLHEELQLPKRIEVSLKEGAYRSIIQTEWTPNASTSKLPLYPSKVEREQFNEADLMEKWVVDVNVAELNIPIEPSVFTWEGLQLPNGKIVRFDGPNGSEFKMHVDGQFRSTSSPKKAFGLLGFGYNYRTLLAAVALATVAGFFLIRRRRRAFVERQS